MVQYKISQRLMLILIMLASTALIVPQLGLRSLWWDEAFSWWFTTVKLGDLWQIAWNHEELNMVLYQGLLNVWSRWGDSEFWLRLPSALFAVGAVWAVARLGRILFESRVALTAALLVALNGFVVVYGQETRAYSMLLFLATLSSYLLVCALKRNEPRYWFGFVVVSVLCGYTHFLGVLQVFSQVLVVGVLVYVASGRVLTRLLIAAGFVLLGMLPIFWFVMTKRSQIDWIPDPTVGSLVLIMKSLVGGGGVMLLALVALVVFGFARRYRDQMPIEGGGSFSPAAYVVLCFLVPIALVFGISLVRPLMVPRYLIATVAPLALAAAVGLMTIPHRAVRAAALVAVTILAFRSSVAQLARVSSDFRSATAYMLEGAAPGDALMFCLPHAKMSFDYYAQHASFVPPTIYPTHPRPYKEPLFGEPGGPSADDLVTLAAGYDRVWMLCTPGGYGAIYGPRLLAAFENSHVILEGKDFPEIRVVQLQKRD